MYTTTIKRTQFTIERITSGAVDSLLEKIDALDEVSLAPAPSADVCGALGCRERSVLLQTVIDGFGRRVLCIDHLTDLVHREVDDAPDPSQETNGGDDRLSTKLTCNWCRKQDRENTELVKIGEADGAVAHVQIFECPACGATGTVEERHSESRTTLHGCSVTGARDDPPRQSSAVAGGGSQR
jgi:hypothetical protein